MAKRIMIVDDDKGYSMLIQYKLQNHGYETEIVNYGADVMRLAMQEDWDVVLLDHKMPDVMGNRVCDNLRSEEKLKNVPIIVVTAHHELSEDVFKSYGATEVIYKPFDDDELLDKIKKCLDEAAAL